MAEAYKEKLFRRTFYKSDKKKYFGIYIKEHPDRSWWQFDFTKKKWMKSPFKDEKQLKNSGYSSYEGELIQYWNETLGEHYGNTRLTRMTSAINQIKEVVNDVRLGSLDMTERERHAFVEDLKRVIKSIEKII